MTLITRLLCAAFLASIALAGVRADDERENFTYTILINSLQYLIKKKSNKGYKGKIFHIIPYVVFRPLFGHKQGNHTALQSLNYFCVGHLVIE